MRVAYCRNLTRDQRGSGRGVRTYQAPVGDRVARQTRVVRRDRVVDELLGLGRLPRDRAVDRKHGPAGEGGRIQRVHEDLPVVPEDADVDDERGESEDEDQDQFEEDEYLPAFPFAVPS